MRRRAAHAFSSIRHLPHGFYEAQLRGEERAGGGWAKAAGGVARPRRRADDFLSFPLSLLAGYFSQFGAVTKVRVSRNKKTGKARAYAFLEFASPAVAAVAAGAMDGYLMFASRLACKVVPPAEVHPELFKGANRTFSKVPWRHIEAKRHNADRSPAGEAKRAARAASRDRSRAAKLAAAGIEYEYEPLPAAPATPEAVGVVEAVVAPAKKRAPKKAAPAAAPAAPAAPVAKRGTKRAAAAAPAAPAAQVKAIAAKKAPAARAAPKKAASPAKKAAGKPATAAAGKRSRK